MEDVQLVRVWARKGFFFFKDAETGANNVRHPLAFDASPEEVQEALEELYGAGSVEVLGGEGNETGSDPYEIRFVDTKVNSIRPIGLEAHSFPAAIPPFGPLEGGVKNGAPVANESAIEGVLAKAPSFRGSQIVATMADVGDAAAHGEGCAKVVAGKGKYTTGECNEEAEPGKGEFEKTPVKILDRLPAGLTAVGIEASNGGQAEPPGACSVVTLTCTFEHALAPYRQVEVRIDVLVSGASSGELNEVSVSGGGAPPARVARAITVGGSTGFGVEHLEIEDEEVGGVSDTQAGSHPFQTTFTVTLNQSVGEFNEGLGKAEAEPAGLAKDLEFRLPPGMIGNPTPFKRCSLAQFFHKPSPTCPEQTVLGVADVTFDEPGTLGLEKTTVPVFNLEPEKGEPARFGFLVTNTSPVFIGSAIRSGEDYGVVGLVNNITQTAALISSEVSLWGVPGAGEHDGQRGLECLAGEAGCVALAESNPPPFWELATSCTGELETSVVGDSWREPLSLQSLPVLATAKMPAMTGCDRLPFRPSISVQSDSSASSTATGLTVDVHNPQEESLNAQGLGEADPRDITVTLPEGVAVNPSGGNGLEACSEGLVGFTGFAEFEGAHTATFTSRLPGSVASIAAGENAPLQPGTNFCADASKVATAEIRTPLLANPLKGAAYIATQNENPFGSLIAMYIVAEDPVSGVLVKLAGEVQLNPSSGQLTTTFLNSPQAPFEDAVLEFFGGERAPLATPAHCGTYTTTAAFTPWSAGPGEESRHASSSFQITQGPDASGCPPATLPFSPSLTGGTTNINAGSFSNLTTTIGREDGNQNLQSVQLNMPPGLSGILTGIPLCPEAQANEGTCPAASQIGETTVSAGVGSDPVTVQGGKVYITESYEGAPFGLAVVNPVKAGPFDLEHDTSNPAQQPPCDCVVVRARIEVNPYTAQLTVTTSPTGPHAIPHIIDGIPVQIKHVNVTINRPGFTFNPTSCDPMAITATITSSENTTQTPTPVPFQVANCSLLSFTPKFTVSTSGKTSKANGASITFKVTRPAGPASNQANFAKAKIDLPKQLPSRLTTLQKACLAAVFDTNPAACPAASIVGHAKVITPLIPVPLEGPAYFVSHGNEAFPSLIMVLQGYGITIDQISSTFIKNGVTSGTLKLIPDAPFTTFELTLPEGPHSALAANTNLCTTTKLNAPTAFVAQNGQEIHQTTPITVTGCPKHTITKHATHKKHTTHKKRTTHKKSA